MKQRGFLELTAATVFGLVALAASVVGVLLGQVAVSRKTPPSSVAEEKCISLTPIMGSQWNNPNFNGTGKYTLYYKVCNEDDQGIHSSASIFIDKEYQEYFVSYSGGWGSPGNFTAGECKTGTLELQLNTDKWQGSPQVKAEFWVGARPISEVYPGIGCYADLFQTLTFGTAAPTATPTLTTPECYYKAVLSIKEKDEAGNLNLIDDPTFSHCNNFGQCATIYGGRHTFETHQLVPPNRDASVWLKYGNKEVTTFDGPWQIVRTWCTPSGTGSCYTRGDAVNPLPGFKMVCGAIYDYGWVLREITSIPTATLTPRPTATVTPTPTTFCGRCGGSCCTGTHQCQSGLTCWGGLICVNPNCPNDDDCICPTATLTPRPTATPTATPTIGCENCVGGTQRRYPSSVWDISGDGQVSDCPEACLAYFGPNCTRAGCGNPGSTDPGRCCWCNTATGASCATLPTPTSPPGVPTATPVPGCKEDITGAYNAACCCTSADCPINASGYHQKCNIANGYCKSKKSCNPNEYETPGTPTPTPDCVPNGGLYEALRQCCSGCDQGQGFNRRCVACPTPTPTPTSIPENCYTSKDSCVRFCEYECVGKWQCFTGGEYSTQDTCLRACEGTCTGRYCCEFNADLTGDGVTNSLDWAKLVTDWITGKYNALDASNFLHTWAAQSGI